MASISDMRVESGQLYVTLSGKVDPSNATNLFAAIRKKALDAGVVQILIDASSVEGTVSVMDRLDLAHLLPQRMGDLQLALVLGKDLFPSGLLAESVATRRQVQIRAFTDIGKAKEWLDVSYEQNAPHQVRKKK